MAKAFSYIRMSTSRQDRGDSRRRQLVLSRDYAAKHGLELDETSFPPDIGLSGYDGTNIQTGSLGRFLAAARSRQLPPDSYLLVESLDRLSRQEIERSMAIFLEIINSGVILVTLSDERVHRAGHFDLGSMILSLSIMSRSHNESFEKSKRLRQSWIAKREKIAERKMTAMCPSWLKLGRDRKRFVVHEDRAAIVRSIFEDAAAGIGLFTITRRLNEARTPPFTSSKGWHQSYVARILKNRAVLGELQPQTTEGGKVVAAGGLQHDYYPRIIDDELFLRVQRGLTQRKNNGAGRKGNNVANLFGGLLRCYDCGGRVVFENKGAKPKGDNYIVCESGRRRHGCEPVRWRYDEFETTFLAVVEEIDLAALFSSRANDANRKAIQDKIDAQKGKLAELEREFDNAWKLTRLPEFKSDLVWSKMSQCESAIAQTKELISHLSTELEQAKAEAASFYDAKVELNQLIAKIKGASDLEVYRIRAQISARLKSIVDEIAVAPRGIMLEKQDQIALAKSIRSEQPDHPVLEVLATVPDYETMTPKDTARFFRVSFKNGTYRVVYPHAADPQQYEEQYFVTPQKMGWLGDSGATTHFLMEGEPLPPGEKA
jgi:DNA invertase Pin-like site-specific DNA recombinase